MNEFTYIRRMYGVHPKIGQRVTIDGKPGTIVEDRGNYLGVNFDQDKPDRIRNCHPTWRVKFLGRGKPERPLMRYHGGKFRLAPWIISHFPEHKTYVEPFGGSAGVLLRKERAHGEVYNDLNGGVVSLFRVLRDPGKTKKLKDLIEFTPYARDEYIQAFSTADCEIEQSRRELVKAYMGFNGGGVTRHSGGFRSDAKRNYSNPAHIWAKLPEFIDTFAQRLKGVVIENQDALKIIKKYDDPQTLFYLDPPYKKETRGNKRYVVDMESHKEMLEKIQSLKGFVVVSGYNSDEYNIALADWKKETSKAWVSHRPDKTECLWLCPRTTSALREGVK